MHLYQLEELDVLVWRTEVDVHIWCHPLESAVFHEPLPLLRVDKGPDVDPGRDGEARAELRYLRIDSSRTSSLRGRKSSEKSSLRPAVPTTAETGMGRTPTYVCSKRRTCSRRRSRGSNSSSPPVRRTTPASRR